VNLEISLDRQKPAKTGRSIQFHRSGPAGPDRFRRTGYNSGSGSRSWSQKIKLYRDQDQISENLEGPGPTFLI
jgi:hypothetical protein